MTSIRPAGGGVSVTLPTFPDAACKGTDLDLWFGPENESNAARDTREAEAVAICRFCPSRRPCLKWALSHASQHGVFGGTGEEHRKALRHARVKRQQRGTEEAA